MALSQQGCNKRMPLLIIVYQGITVIRERQTHDAAANNIIDAAEGYACNGLPGGVEKHPGTHFKTVRLSQHYQPVW
jgi:hypothetical protein